MVVRSAYYDVDNTLVDDDLVLFENVENKLRQHAEKYVMHCWSHGGREYAKRVLEKHNLLDYFMQEMEVFIPDENRWVMAQVPMVLDKPDVLIDDQPQLLLDMSAHLIPTHDKWWAQRDSEMFKDSRKRKKEEE